jgi:hypothetical protein
MLYIATKARIDGSTKLLVSFAATMEYQELMENTHAAKP